MTPLNRNRSLLLACTVGFTAAAFAHARASELNRTDKLRALYSTQFSFDQRNVPLLTIAITEELTTLEIWSEQPIRVLPDGEDGTEIVSGTRWRITLKQGTPARVEHFVVLSRAAASQLPALQKDVARWQATGIPIRVLEVGSLFGIAGQVFDNRGFLLTEGPFATAEAANQRGDAYVAQGLIEKRVVVPQLADWPSALIEAVALDGTARITVKDALWFAPHAPGALLSAIDRDGAKRRYRGSLYVAADRHGKLALVNHLPTDLLLAGLVSAEIFPSAPDAALQAQSIAARGNLLAKIGHQSFADPYLTCAWVRCQVYRGAGYENERTTRAIQATRGLVLVRQADSKIVDAVYHADSGGHTENNDRVWFTPADPALRGRLDAPPGTLQKFAGGITEDNIRAWLAFRPDTWGERSGFNRDKQRWQITHNVKLLSENAKAHKLGRLRDIRVLARGVSGRAYLVELTGVLGQATVQGELVIRRLFGNLPSAMFVVETKTNARGEVEGFVFTGGGWGHGAGMAQTGAIGMAKAGKGYAEILQQYYTGAEVRRIY